MPSFEAVVRPQLLVWARESIGLEPAEVAARLHTSDGRVRSWEAGESRPTVAQLRHLSEIYKRPLAAFYLPEPPRERILVHDFRAHRGEGAGGASPDLLLEMRLARRRSQVAFEVAHQLGSDVQSFALHADRKESIEGVAARMRTSLEFSIEEQRKLRSAARPLERWIKRVERLGALVFQASRVPLDEMRGFSISDTPIPVVVLNGKDAPRARAFTLLHELAHLTLHTEGVCDLREPRRLASADQRVEAFANAVAAATLIPRDSLLSQPSVSRAGPRSTWSDDELSRLADLYWVSREVVLRRLLALEKTSKAFYEERRKLFLHEYEQMRAKGHDFGPPFHQLVVRNNGPTFTRLILDGYRRNALTPIDVADYLGASLRHLPKIEDAVEAVGA